MTAFRHLIEIDLLHARLARAESANEALTAELALVNDTLRHRTESHGRLVRDRLACPHCSTLPIEETPSE